MSNTGGGVLPPIRDQKIVVLPEWRCIDQRSTPAYDNLRYYSYSGFHILQAPVSKFQSRLARALCWLCLAVCPSTFAKRQDDRGGDGDVVLKGLRV